MHEGEKPYSCGTCDTGFAFKAILKTFMREKSREGRKLDMKKQIQSIHKEKNKNVHEEKKEYKCFVCHKIFGKNKTLKGQMSYVHKEIMPVHEKRSNSVALLAIRDKRNNLSILYVIILANSRTTWKDIYNLFLKGKREYLTSAMYGCD